MSKKHPFLIVMKAMLMGRPVQLGKNYFVCADNNQVGTVQDDGNVLCFRDGPSVNYLIGKAEEMGEEELIGIAAGMALQEIAEERLKKREHKV